MNLHKIQVPCLFPDMVYGIHVGAYRVCVSHKVHKCVASLKGCHSTCHKVLLVRLARIPEMCVDINKCWKKDQPPCIHPLTIMLQVLSNLFYDTVLNVNVLIKSMVPINRCAPFIKSFILALPGIYMVAVLTLIYTLVFVNQYKFMGNVPF